MRKFFKKIATFSMVAVLGISIASPLNIPNRDMVTVKAESTSSLPYNRKDGSYTTKDVVPYTFNSDDYFDTPVSRAIDFYTKQGDFAAYPTNPSLYWHKVGGSNFYLDKKKEKVTRTLTPEIPNLP